MLVENSWRGFAMKQCKKHIDNFHNPSKENIEGLLKNVFGSKEIIEVWTKETKEHESLLENLNKMIEKRQAIAHRVSIIDNISSEDLVENFETLKQLILHANPAVSAIYPSKQDDSLFSFRKSPVFFQFTPKEYFKSRLDEFGLSHLSWSR